MNLKTWFQAHEQLVVGLFVVAAVVIVSRLLSNKGGTATVSVPTTTPSLANGDPSATGAPGYSHYVDIVNYYNTNAPPPSPPPAPSPPQAILLPRCHIGTHWDYKQRMCVNDARPPAPPTCQPGQMLVNGICVSQPIITPPHIILDEHEPCPPGREWDSMSHSCRPIHCGPGEMLSNGMCVAIPPATAPFMPPDQGHPLGYSMPTAAPTGSLEGVTAYTPDQLSAWQLV